MSRVNSSVTTRVHVAPVRVLARGVADAAEAALVAHTDGVLLVAELQTLALL